MKMRFASVLLHKAIPRLGSRKGFAGDTTLFDAEKDGIVIELNTASGLVRLSQGTSVCYVPPKMVERFGDVSAAPRATTAPAAESAPDDDASPEIEAIDVDFDCEADTLNEESEQTLSDGEMRK